MIFLGRLRTAAFPPVAGIFTLRYVAGVFVLSYLVWVVLFVNYRYAVPLEMIASLVVVAAIAVWPIGFHKHASLAIAIMGFCVVTVKAGTWGRMP